MRVLLIKTSSMGDLIHTLPALTDAKRACPDIQFDWLVEEGFADIPKWHAAVDRVIPVALRRWRKALFKKATWSALSTLKNTLREQPYDVIIDAQGLLKSAWLGLLAIGPRAGFAWASVREPMASLFYQQTYQIDPKQHAILRMRSLFAKALDYDVRGEPDFGLSIGDCHPEEHSKEKSQSPSQYLVFLHGTTWASKQWPEQYWVELARMAAAAGYRIKVSGASDAEVARSYRMAKACDAIDVMPRLRIADMAELLAGAKGVVAVDTGFAHLAAAMALPMVSIYGATNPEYTGAVGKHSNIVSADFACAPCLQRECTYQNRADVMPACYQTILPKQVWHTLQV